MSVTRHFFLVFECPPRQSQERVTKKILVASIRDRSLSYHPPLSGLSLNFIQSAETRREKETNE